MKRPLALLVLLLSAFALLSGCGGGGGDSGDLQTLKDEVSGGTGGGGGSGQSAGLVGGLTLTQGAVSIVADGSSATLIRAAVLDSGGAPAAGVSVAFAASFGSFAGAAEPSKTSKVTDAAGIAEVSLRSTSTPALAVVTATAGGFTKEAQVRFVPGPADAAHSSLTANPQAVPADGASTTTISVSLADANGLPVSNGTPVTLFASAGTVTSPNPAATASGRAEFTLQAPASQGTAQLSVAEVPGLGAEVVFGVVSSGEPAGMHLSVVEPEIAVSGVGQVEETKFTIQVVDVSGDPISENGYADPAVDNLRVRFATRPNGGEFITGANAAGQIVQATDTGTVEVRSRGGSATLNLHAGERPGAVELYVEFLRDKAGALLAKPLAASLPLAAIASGPPHTIALSVPVQDAIAPVHGEYDLHARATVTDRYGNPVPDGTAVYLGVIDTLISTGSASSAAGSATLTAAPGSGFDQKVTRNDSPGRGIQVGDRILLSGGIADHDKARYVAAPPAVGVLTASSPYSQAYGAASYNVGAALTGSYIRGTNAAGQRTHGLSTVKDGVAEVFFTYPANIRTLNLGCGDVPSIDTRYEPRGSADVLVVAESASDPNPAASLDRAVTIAPTAFCFAPLAGFKLSAAPSALTATADVLVSVQDGADVPVPFEWVIPGVEIKEAPGGSGFSIVPTACRTDETATCTSRVTITGTTAPGKYDAVIHYQAGDGVVDVPVKLVR